MHWVLGSDGDVMVIDHPLDFDGFCNWIKGCHSICYLDDLSIDSFPWRGRVRRHELIVEVLEVFSEALRAANS